MAKPDTDHGWVQIAYELDAAFGYADFSKPAQAIIRMIRGQVYGYRKLALARLTVAEVVARTGQRRQNVERAFREILDSGAITSSEADSYGIAKDYETWTRREVPRDYESAKIPRLTQAEVADCKASKGYADGGIPAQSRLNPVGCKKGIQLDAPDESKWIPKGIQMDSKLNPIGCGNESKWIPSPIEERAPEDKTQKEKTNTPEPAPRGERDEVRSIPYPEGVDPQAPNLISKADRAELDRLAALCDVHFPMLAQIRRVVSEREGSYPIWAYETALEELRRVDRSKWGRNYLIGIISRVAAGGKEAAKARLPQPMANAVGAAPGGWRPHNMPIATDEYKVLERVRAAQARKAAARQ
jgi:hypothetical protein